MELFGFLVNGICQLQRQIPIVDGSWGCVIPYPCLFRRYTHCFSSTRSQGPFPAFGDCPYAVQATGISGGRQQPQGGRSSEIRQEFIGCCQHSNMAVTWKYEICNQCNQYCSMIFNVCLCMSFSLSLSCTHSSLCFFV
jgi:hypothetical protein